MTRSDALWLATRALQDRARDYYEISKSRNLSRDLRKVYAQRWLANVIAYRVLTEGKAKR